MQQIHGNTHRCTDAGSMNLGFVDPTSRHWITESEVLPIAAGGYWASRPLPGLGERPVGRRRRRSRHNWNGRCERPTGPPSKPAAHGARRRQQTRGQCKVVAKDDPQQAPPLVANPVSDVPLLPEHFAIIASYMSSDVDSGVWRSVSKAALASIAPDGPHVESLGPGGKAALQGLQRRKQLRKILHSARRLVAGLST